MATDQPTIRILKPGSFIDIHGNRVTFTRADLADVARSYDREANPAPLVIGHPKHDDPAYGWVDRVELQGDELVATPADIEPAFAEAVRAKRYRKVSASLYPPAHPSNPTPGRWALKHVGFLGAAAPGVKGLGTVSFSDADDDTAVTLIPDQEQPVTDTPDTPTETIGLAEHTTQTGALQARIDALEAEKVERDRADAEAARTARHAENVAFAEGLIAAGHLAPAAKDKVVGLMDQLEATATVSFGEGDEVTPLAAFRSLFDAAQPVVALGELAGADRTVASPSVVVSFAAPAGYAAAPDNAELHGRAKAIQAATPGITFWDAFTRARTEAAAG